MRCCNCGNCSSGECFPQDHESLEKWRKDFDNLRKQWSDYLVCGNAIDTDCCHCCCKDSCPKLVKGRFGLAWVSETPRGKTCTPCGWQLEICDTPSQVEYQCRRMEQWANCPPVDDCVSYRKPKRCCVKKPHCVSKSPCHKPPCCSVKVMPFKASSQECCCSKCKSEKNDKAIATDECICNANKNDNKVAENSKDNQVKDILLANNENKPTPQAPATPRARSRGRRGRR